jgi:hypothetical protein
MDSHIENTAETLREQVKSAAHRPRRGHGGSACLAVENVGDGTQTGGVGEVRAGSGLGAIVRGRGVRVAVVGVPAFRGSSRPSGMRGRLTAAKADLLSTSPEKAVGFHNAAPAADQRRLTVATGWE